MLKIKLYLLLGRIFPCFRKMAYEQTINRNVGILLQNHFKDFKDFSIVKSSNTVVRDYQYEKYIISYIVKHQNEEFNFHIKHLEDNTISTVINIHDVTLTSKIVSFLNRLEKLDSRSLISIFTTLN